MYHFIVERLGKSMQYIMWRLQVSQIKHLSTVSCFKVASMSDNPLGKRMVECNPQLVTKVQNDKYALTWCNSESTL